MESFKPSRPGGAAVIAIYLTCAAEVARTLTSPELRDPAPYLGLFLLFIVLFSLVLWRPTLRPILRHLYLLAQSVLVLALLALNPDLDHVTALFALLCYQAGLLVAGGPRWAWVGILALLPPVSLLFFLGLRGLALGLTPLSAAVVLAIYVAVTQETERARAQSQSMLNALQASNAQLQVYAAQAEELAAAQERIRLARELHDSVSQTMFSITLNARSAQILTERDPARVRAHLEQLQALTRGALSEMRGLIAQLRAQSN